MLEKTNDNFYTRGEKFVESNSKLEVESVKVGVRITFDLLNGQIIVTEQAFASMQAFEAGAMPIPMSEQNESITGEDFDKFFKTHSSFARHFKELFEAGSNQAKERDRIAAETSEQARAERLDLLTKEIEKAGGQVIFPTDENAKEEK